ncbi:MAG TPA: amidohydrolase family protein [Clostridium sp.]|uniref:amidohydrolase family protein n=1 Tax=Clostridium sp. TaxID=1506 RepID=UPI002F932A53
MFDIVINNGTVIDPSNKINSKLNIGISKGKIACISKECLSGNTEINAEFLIVTPGFIDMHMHEDPYNAKDDSFEYCISNSMLNMGVTTAIGGNCGLGPSNPIEYLDAVDRKGYPINLAMYAPHESLRNTFGDFDKYGPVDKEIIEKMANLLKLQLDQGCIGFSMGIEYIPGIDQYEATELMKVTSKSNKLVAVHQRGDAKKAISSIEEIINYAKATKASLQISHVSSMCSFGQMEETLSIIDNFRNQGLDIGFDSYPYYAYCTFIGSSCFDEGFLEEYDLDENSYSKLEGTTGEFAGKRFSKDTFDKQRKSDPKALVIAHVLGEKEVDMAITHHTGIIVSDGLYKNGQGHPRGSGTFPRFINEFVKKKKLLTLETAIEKITFLPANRMGLLSKGTLSLGADADVTIFDFNKIEDGATYLEPVKKPIGIEYVIIGGEIALKHSSIVNSKLGKAIKK